MTVDRRLAVPGAYLAYGVLGSGPAVVFLHGAGLDHTTFLPQARAVAEAGHLAVLVDLRGHGESALEPGARFTAETALADLVALLDHLAVERPVIVGHSLGGNLAQEFVRRHGDRVGALVAVDTTWNAGPLTRLERFALRLAAPTLALVPASRLPRLMAGASAEGPEAVAECERIFARMPKATFLDVWRATVSLVSPEPGYRCPVPLALIRGERDGTGNIARSMPAWAAFEGIDERVVADAGHVVMLDAPEECSRVLVDVLDGWTPDTPRQRP